MFKKKKVRYQETSYGPASHLPTTYELVGLRNVLDSFKESIYTWHNLPRRDRLQAYMNYAEAFGPRLIDKLFAKIEIAETKAESWERAYAATEAARFALEEEVKELKEKLAAVPTPDEEQVRKYIISKLSRKERLL